MRITKKMEGIEAHRAKHPTPSQATDTHIGEEGRAEAEERKKKETESGSPTQLPWTIWSSLTTCMDYTVGLF